MAGEGAREPAETAWGRCAEAPVPAERRPGPGKRLCSGPVAAHKGQPRSPACGAGAAPAVLRHGRRPGGSIGAERSGTERSGRLLRRDSGREEGGAGAAPGEGPAASRRPGQRQRRRHHPSAGRQEGAGRGGAAEGWGAAGKGRGAEGAGPGAPPAGAPRGESPGGEAGRERRAKGALRTTGSGAVPGISHTLTVRNHPLK